MRHVIQFKSPETNMINTTLKIHADIVFRLPCCVFVQLSLKII